MSQGDELKAPPSGTGKSLAILKWAVTSYVFWGAIGAIVVVMAFLAPSQPDVAVNVSNGLLLALCVFAYFRISRGPIRVSIVESRRRPSLGASELKIDQALVGVADGTNEFSHVAFWFRSDASVTAVYLSPRWPYLPLRIEEHASFEELLSSPFGREVRLLQQDEYAEAVMTRYFAAVEP